MTPKQEFDGFLAKYSPEIVAETKRAHAKMRKLVPGAVELVYDNYNALVVGFGPSEKAGEAVFSLAMYPKYICVCFLQGARLADPDGLLRGSGTTVRNIRLASSGDLDDPSVISLIETALREAKVPIDADQKRRMVIKSVSAKQKPRRPRA